GRERKCKLGREVLSEELGLQSFLKIERDAPALVVLGSSFHQPGTTNENSLDCRACTDGSAKRRSVALSLVLSLFPSVCFSLSLFLSLFPFPSLSVSLCLCFSLCFPLHLSLFLSVSSSLSLSLSISL